MKLKNTRWAGYVACMGAIRNAYKISVRNLEGKRQLGRCRYTWEDNTKVDLKQQMRGTETTEMSLHGRRTQNDGS
jgi:hypothetical protein